MKKLKPLKEAHTSNSQKGMGSYYGTGKKNPVASLQEKGKAYLKSKDVGKPPKSLA